MSSASFAFTSLPAWLSSAGLSVRTSVLPWVWPALPLLAVGCTAALGAVAGFAAGLAACCARAVTAKLIISAIAMPAGTRALAPKTTTISKE
jgi:hypothetical protein